MWDSCLLWIFSCFKPLFIFNSIRFGQFFDKFNFAILRLCENVNGETGKWEEDLQNGEVLSNKTDLSHLNNFKQSLSDENTVDSRFNFQIVLKHHPDLRLCAEHVPDSVAWTISKCQVIHFEVTQRQKQEHEDMRIILRDASFMACHWTYDARCKKLGGWLKIAQVWKVDDGGWLVLGNQRRGWSFLLSKSLEKQILQENLDGDFSLSMVPCASEPDSDQNTFGVWVALERSIKYKHKHKDNDLQVWKR